MAKLKDRQALEKLRKSLQPKVKKGPQRLISLCAGSGCGAYGTAKVHEALTQELAAQKSGRGRSQADRVPRILRKVPIMVIHPEGIFYPQVTAEKVPEIVKTTLIGKELVDKLLYKDPVTKKKISHEHEIPFYKLQKRVMFGKNGLIDPTGSRITSPWAGIRPGQGTQRHEPAGDHFGDQEVRPQRPRRRRIPHGTQVGDLPQA